MPDGDHAIPALRVEGDAHVVDVDESIYCREAVLRAAYWQTDRCYLFVSRPREGVLRVWIRGKPGGPSVDDAAGAFLNALVDHELRVEIGRETRAVRDLIVAKAFAEGGVLGETLGGPASQDSADSGENAT